jgi:Domain of unknown function (DUF4157)
MLQRKRSLQNNTETLVTPSAFSGVPPIVHEVLRSPGQPLTNDTRAFMEPRFGHDFSGVRVHTDLRAADSAQAVNALAYTVGQDVVFGAGQHRPQTLVGQRLLAHELAHTIQQRDNRPQPTEIVKVSPPGHPSEREAVEISDSILAINPVSASFKTRFQSKLSGRYSGLQRAAAGGSMQQSPFRRKTLLFNPTKHVAPRPPGAPPEALVLANPEQAQVDLNDAISSVRSGQFKVGRVDGGSSFAQTAVYDMGASASMAKWLPAFQRAAGEANERAEWVFRQVTGTTPAAGSTQIKPNRNEVNSISPSTLPGDISFPDGDKVEINLIS